jgi:phosphate transport system ATP-binding protein
VVSSPAPVATNPANQGAARSAQASVTAAATAPRPSSAAAVAAVKAARTSLSVEALSAFFGSSMAVRSVSMDVPEKLVTAIIGASGSGKSTLLRCLNRMHETVPTGRVKGTVALEGQDIYGKDVNPIEVRKKIGMVFQRPTPFPTMSIKDNVSAGLRVKKNKHHHKIDDVVEKALKRAALWDEVKDRLRDSATGLSGGQQQRLCIARALATDPDVLLLDEPTASLDPISTQKVEELVYELRGDMTVVIVTHNMQQAARVSDRTAFMLQGELVEYAATGQLFTNPSDHRTEAYITGRFG